MKGVGDFVGGILEFAGLNKSVASRVSTEAMTGLREIFHNEEYDVHASTILDGLVEKIKQGGIKSRKERNDRIVAMITIGIAGQENYKHKMAYEKFVEDRALNDNDSRMRKAAGQIFTSWGYSLPERPASSRRGGPSRNGPGGRS